MKGVSFEYVDVVGEQMFGGECSSVKEDTGDKAMKETKVNVTTDRTARRITNELGSCLQDGRHLEDAES